MSRTRHSASGTLRGASALLAAGALLAVAGCAADPSVTYRESAVSALEGTLSEARTAELAGRLWVAGRSSHSFTVVVVSGSDTGVGADAAWFEAQQPPRRLDDAVRRKTADALDAAASAVQSVRIALDRSDRLATRAALDELRAACNGLESLAGELS